MEQINFIHKSNDIEIKITLNHNPEYQTKEAIQHIHLALETNTLFYKDCDKPPTNITFTLLTYRKEYDDVLGWQSSSWGSGLTRENNIYTFHPDRRAIESSHSRESFVNTLTHEICHVFSRNLYGDELWWTREGVAQYVGGQNELKQLSVENIEHFITNSLDKNIKYSDFVNNHQGHQISKRMGFAVAEVYGISVLHSLQATNPTDPAARQKIASLLGTSMEKLDETIRNLLRKDDLQNVVYLK